MSKSLMTAKDQRRRRTRSKIEGSAERPRLSVHISNRHITAQLIDDSSGKTLAQVTSRNQSKQKASLTETAKQMGEAIADLASKHKVKSVVFDRGHRIYHSRLNALAEAARQKGLEV